MSLPSINDAFNRNAEQELVKQIEPLSEKTGIIEPQQFKVTQNDSQCIISDFLIFGETTQNQEVGSEDAEFFTEYEKLPLQQRELQNEIQNESQNELQHGLQNESQHGLQNELQHGLQHGLQNELQHELQNESQLPSSYIYNSFQFNTEEVKDKEWETVEATTITTCDIKDYIQSKRGTTFLNVNTEDLSLLFKCFFSENMVQLLVNGTNEKAKECDKSPTTINQDTNAITTDRTTVNPDEEKCKKKWKEVSIDEMYAYIAVLMYAGSCRCGCKISDLFSDDAGLPFVRICFSRKRFEDISRFLRCDLKAERAQREKNGVLFLIIHDLMSLFQKNCVDHAIPSEIVAVDERMCSFRGRAQLRTYMPNKPDKFGMLMHCLVDYDTKYCYGLMLYLGKLYEYNGHFGQSIVENLVKKLPTNKHFILGCDQLFTTFDLCTNMKERKVDIVGTVNVNSTSLPPFCKRNLVLQHKKLVTTEMNKETKALKLFEEQKKKFFDLQQKTEVTKTEKKWLEKHGIITIEENINLTKVKLEEATTNFKKVEEKTTQNPFNICFYKKRDVLVCNFNPSNLRKVNIMTSLMYPVIVEDNKKAFVNLVYNIAKTPVDTLDQSTKYYMYNNRTCRWNVKIIYNVVSLASNNAFSAYSSKHKQDNIKKTKTDFFKEMAIELALPYIASHFNKNKTNKKYSFIRDLGMIKIDLEMINKLIEKQQLPSIPSLSKDVVIEKVNKTVTVPSGSKLWCTWGKQSLTSFTQGSKALCPTKTTQKCAVYCENVCCKHSVPVCLECVPNAQQHKHN